MSAGRYLFALLLTTLAAAACRAEVTQISIDSFDNGVVENTRTNDISIDFDGKYTGSQLILQLEEGSIYRHEFGNLSPPNSAFFIVFPELEFDTFLANGQATSGSGSSVFSWGGALNLGGSSSGQFLETSLDVAWTTDIGSPNIQRDLQGFLTGRITLTEDARGTWSYLASASRVMSYYENLPIEGGQLSIPLLPLDGDYDDSGLVSQGDLDIVFLNWGDSLDQYPGRLPTAPPGDPWLHQEILDFVLLNWGKTPEVQPAEVYDAGEYTGTQTGLGGDFNGSGKVEQADADLFLLNIGPYDGSPIDGWVNDLPEPGFTINCCNVGDKLVRYWGDELPASGEFQVVPEPSAFALSSLIVATVLTCGGSSRWR